ncbi:hypothetical protein GCM10010967_52340 [Dyadobacter beijingensis]|uniref:Gingipain domain-containing protein n=1 Tax=Dyadobacter beijingensis TaxID=365489 RepID=A0ABQ2IIP9_9BACT|nr:C25 family cysteine peptidase [Dyadobacter beijingensis]GGN09971.1 hypothetical protein GCM10010967_52340 [Dyadobacter beijingensis]
MKHFLTAAAFVIFLLTGITSQAQWGAPYANSWIDYGKPYVKIGITKKGLHKIAFSSLPENFPTGDPARFQLWRRGKKVSIISTANEEILFYALPNDGASDSLLYRPMSARMNPYFSMYSDEGAYFLTIADGQGTRAKVLEQPADANVPLLAHHRELATTVFRKDYSLGTKYSVKPELLNSYFEIGASWTGDTCKEGSQLLFNLKLDNFINTPEKPTIKLMVHGRSNNARKIEIYIGKNKNTMRLVKSLDNAGFAGTEYSFPIGADDLDATQNGFLKLRSVSGERLERFSIAYYCIDYPQSIQIDAQASKELRLVSTNDKWSRISLKGVSSQLNFVDISDAHNPVVLKPAGENLMVPRQSGIRQVLLATSEITAVAPAKVKEAPFTAFDPKAANYIIITTEELRPGAALYAGYRSSAAGGGYKPVIAGIQDIYNQFNYGEPSPVAIRKFMCYMLSDGNREKYLLLIGKSITQNEKMVRELPGEVPTVGFPGSDLMLVEGIAGAAVNHPAIPVGRISAVTNQNMTDYLQKVKAYEANRSGDYGWRKRVLHLSGGKTTSEIVQLRDYLRGVENKVLKTSFGGTLKHYVKRQAMQEVEPVNITEEVNEGLGMITFLGHGNTIHSDPDIGHARDASRGYANLNKYPVMYFTGCGVGNVFSNRFNPNPKNPDANDRITLSLDWLVAPDRGAIAVIASTYESYVSPGVTYLESLYHHMFENEATGRLPIGKIQLAVAADILAKYSDRFNVAYVHQSLLQGDPALRLVTVDKPDYAIAQEEGIKLLAEAGKSTIGASDSVRVRLNVANFGKFVSDQTVPVKVSLVGKNGEVNRVTHLKAFPSLQETDMKFRNETGLKSIRVEIDPDRTLSELDRKNNVSELYIDWDIVKDEPVFTDKSLKDIVPPVLTLKIDDRLPRQGELLRPEPRMQITLTDDRPLAADTSLIDLFIKPCVNDDCDFKKISYAKSRIHVNASARELLLDYPTSLPPGQYELLINAKDQAGNALSQSYRMIFEIAKPEEMRHELIVSPNPATSYLRFELKAASSLPLKSIRYLIHDQRGILMEDKTIAVIGLSSVLEWYWLRPDIGAGVYNYKVIMSGENDDVLDTRSGKVVLVR